MLPKMSDRLIKFITLTSVSCIAGLLVLLIYIGPVGTGMAAKVACSSAFISGLRPAMIRANELAPYGYLNVEINQRNRTAKASLASLFQRTAYFNPRQGCQLDAPPIVMNPLAAPARTAVTAPPSLLPITTPSAALAPILAKAFQEPDPNHKRATRAIIVVNHGQMIAEAYGPSIQPSTPLIG